MPETAGTRYVARGNDMATLEQEIKQAERKAIDSLARYKFMMFGYWAGIWVHLNKIEGKRRPSPFSQLVKTAQIARWKHETTDS